MKYGLIAVLLATLAVLGGCGKSVSPDTRTSRSALIIVDMQYDFMPGGSLATQGGDEIVELINSLQHRFDLVVATQDWHPPGHGSFASAHPGHEKGDIVDLFGLPQVLWPDHAVQQSPGTQLVAELDKARIAKVFRKGTDPAVDSYSGFFDNGKRGDTGLKAFLQSEAINEVFVVGLALDYCVKYTALDARSSGWDTTVLIDASRAVNLQPGDHDKAVNELLAAGVRVATSSEVLH